MERIVLRNRGDLQKIVDKFGCSRVTAVNALNFRTNNSFRAHIIRQYAIEELKAATTTFED